MSTLGVGEMVRRDIATLGSLRVVFELQHCLVDLFVFLIAMAKKIIYKKT